MSLTPHELRQQHRQRVLSQAADQYPMADRDVLAALNLEPEQVLEVAAKLHEKAQLRDNTSGLPFPPTNQSDAALSADAAQRRRWQTQVRSNHLRRDMDPVEREMAFEAFFADGWNAHIAERKRRVGGS